MDSLIQDIRYAFRTLLNAPGFTLVATLTLALGIGANTAIFSVVNAVLLRPLPFADSDRLMSVYTMNTRHAEEPGTTSMSYADFIDYRAQNHSFEDLATYYGNDFSLTGGSEPLLLRGQIVGTSFFSLLRVQPAIGRGFLPGEDQPGHPVAVISHALWRSRFGSDPNISGRKIELSGNPYTIVGVAPAHFQFPIGSRPTDIWVSSSKDAEIKNGEKPLLVQRGAHFLNVLGRLKPGVTREQAETDLSAIALSLSQSYPDTNLFEKSASVKQVLTDLVGDTQRPLMILLAAVGCVLLIACANVANLVLARSISRSREIAVRAALGASKFRIIRQLVTQSLVLAALGAVLGTLFARWAVSAVVQIYPENLPRAQDVSLDTKVLLFTAALTVLTGLLFGLAPALLASRVNLNEAMREGGRGSGGSARYTRLRSGLVIAETAVGVMLLIGAGLLIRSMHRLSHVDLGFAPDHIITASFEISQTKYKPDQQDRFITELLNRLRSIPGVTSAGAIGQLPLSNDDWSISFNILERPLPKSQHHSAGFYQVSPGLFETMKIPLLRGRTFDEHDTRDGKSVMVINSAFQKQYFPNEDPIGKMIEIGAGDGKDRERWKTREVVGVVGDIRTADVAAATRPAYFVPIPQLIWGAPTLVIRTAGDPNNIVPELRQTMQSMDPDAPLYDIKLLEDYLALALGRARFETMLLSLFGAVALVLTTVGLYGVIAYTVAQRTHEIGVRIALGASRTHVLRMLLNRGLLLTLSGVAIGVIGALGLAKLIASMLYETPPRDPLTYFVVSFSLCAVALLASLVPASRASRIDPITALRYE
ncbi:MAG TPA: ABC transporter permease [Candidatus Angelobacter sp.]|nr:ABC transporter permease [Candidatus Angelobacter sp.]